MERYRIRRMAERLAVKITRNAPQDRFEKELWDLAAIIEEPLLCDGPAWRSGRAPEEIARS